MSHTEPAAVTSFGIMTAPQQVSYRDILRVWKEADTVPQIKHAWLFDHLLPIGGNPNGPIFGGLDAALGSCRTDRTAAPRSAGDQQPP